MTAFNGEFRRAARGDVESIVNLIESAYRGERSRAGWTTEADLLDGQRTDQTEIEGILDDSRARLMLIGMPQDLMGCILVKDIVDAAYIGMLAVNPSLQSRGLGRRLLEEAECVARREFRARLARMTVIVQRDDLISWYRRRGYSVTGAREPFPYGNPRFGLPRRPDLEFAVLEKLLEV